jgi:MerR family transcriptional regulator, repressor of the yfmOP operon
MDKTTYQIDEVAAKTGLTKRALRYYEDLNLITPLRKDSGYRLYSEENVATILHIKEIRENLGFCLNDIKEILELEKNLQAIFKRDTADFVLIEKSLAMMKNQIALIEKKEQSIARVKVKYQKAFINLQQFYSQCKEGTYQHEET